VEAGQVGGVFLEGFSDLDREFARRRQYQRLWFVLCRIDSREDRQRERGGLSNYKDSADTPYMTREDFIRLFR